MCGARASRDIPLPRETSTAAPSLGRQNAFAQVAASFGIAVGAGSVGGLIFFERASNQSAFQDDASQTVHKPRNDFVGIVSISAPC